MLSKPSPLISLKCNWEGALRAPSEQPPAPRRHRVCVRRRDPHRRSERLCATPVHSDTTANRPIRRNRLLPHERALDRTLGFQKPKSDRTDPPHSGPRRDARRSIEYVVKGTQDLDLAEHWIAIQQHSHISSRRPAPGMKRRTQSTANHLSLTPAERRSQRCRADGVTRTDSSSAFLCGVCGETLFAFALREEVATRLNQVR